MDNSEELIARHLPAARAQCSQSWSQLIKRFQGPLLAYCTEITSDREESFDLTQKTFLRAMRYLHTLREDRKFASWLYSIARQQSVDYLRRCGRRSKLEAQLGRQPSPDALPRPEETLVKNDETQLAIQLLRDLEPELREPLVLHYLEDFSLDDIVDIMESPKGTIKSRLHRARKILRTQLEEAHEPAVR